MFQTMARPTASLVTAMVLFSPSNWPYKVPLASRSVGDAYFLGQHNDEKNHGVSRNVHSTSAYAVPRTTLKCRSSHNLLDTSCVSGRESRQTPLLVLTAVLLYVIVITLLARARGLVSSIFVSLVAAVCLMYLAPPSDSFRVNEPLGCGRQLSCWNSESMGIPAGYCRGLPFVWLVRGKERFVVQRAVGQILLHCV